MPRGSQKGTNNGGGRKLGSKNKTTIEREIVAAQVIDNAKNGKRELAKDVLERLMIVAEGATGVNRPVTQAQLNGGAAANPDGDWDRFGEWFDRTAYCAKELAKYQSPQFRAMAWMGPVPGTPEAPAPKQVEGKVLKINDPNASARVYLQMVKRDAAA